MIINEKRRPRQGRMQGFGDLNPTAIVSTAISSLYDTMEVRTALTPPAVINLKTALDPNSPPSPVAQFLQPTIVLTGPSGQQVIAPYGQAPDGTAGTIGVVAFLMGIGFAVGYFVRSRR